WLRGNGAAAINNLMEDPATAEISRSQLWQWVHTGAQLADGRTVTADLVRSELYDVLAELQQSMVSEAFVDTKLAQAGEIFARVALEYPFIEFLTLPAYDLID
ncbi:MAG: malate synthase A, partial [Thermoleophilia bacterium]|nr:malate synthase A [Thermoleophilia bacterium]